MRKDTQFYNIVRKELDMERDWATRSTQDDRGSLESCARISVLIKLLDEFDRVGNWGIPCG